jgi:hypothetical protein
MKKKAFKKLFSSKNTSSNFMQDVKAGQEHIKTITIHNAELLFSQ